MNILLAGGGSGGPVSPLLAVAEQIKLKHPNAKFLLRCRSSRIGGLGRSLVLDSACRLPQLRLPAALKRFVGSQVRGGTYRSRKAVVVAAVSHHERRSEWCGSLESEVAKGLDSESAGEVDCVAVILLGRRRAAARARMALRWGRVQSGCR